MMARMRHRGPDGEGVWQSGNGRVTLGHVRLAIVDTSDAGAQPMHHPDGLHQTVNGEIYNYPDLRRRLAPTGKHPFQSHCDVEVILHGVAAEGRGFLRELNGMFAFALADDRSGEVWLVRDRLGIKPLYWLAHEGRILFASEIKALFGAIKQTEWAIDPLGLSQFMAFQTPLGETTLFEGVRQLLPGHMLRVDSAAPDKAVSEAYWSLDELTPGPSSFPEACRAFEEIFPQGVARHLLSDVGVSSYLSAGFDSALVTSEAARIKNQTGAGPLAAFTGYFDMGTPWYDETGPAGELAAHAGIRHSSVEIRQQDFAGHVDRVIDALDAPQMGMGAFSQYMVARSAAADFKVILTGHGGDELFSGYPVFKQAAGLPLRRASELPHLAYFALSRHRGRTRPEFGRGLPVLWPVAEQEAMLGRSLAGLAPWAPFDSLKEACPDPVDRLLRTYLSVYLPGLLVVEDKISMAHSMEARTPFLDNAVVELAGSLPQHVKLHRAELKAVIRDAARKRLPETYFQQPKRGFPTPLRFWLRHSESDGLIARLISPSGPLGALFAPDALQGFVQDYRESWRRRFRPLDEIQSHRLWQLLALEAWLRIWADRYGITLKLA